MAEILCGYSNRDEMLVAYAYDEIEPAERGVFEAHLAACAQCRHEIAELAGVREQLAHWTVPEPAGLLTNLRPISVFAARRRASWRELPAWAQVAAALLFFGVGAGLANLDVRYDHDGVTVRTGWSRPSVVAGPSERGEPAPASIASAAAAPWRTDLAALERQLRSELQPSAAGAARIQPAGARATADADLVRRVRAMIDESERRQQTELALRVAQVVRDVNAQRQADLVRIDRTLGQMQNTTGVEVMKQRELLNYVMRVSMQK